MEDVARLADRVLVLNRGRVHAFGCPADVFADDDSLAAAGLSVPRTAAFLRTLQDFLPDLDCNCYSAAAAVKQLIRAFRKLRDRLQSTMLPKAGDANDR
jgi:energy-coupling factor transport system ATP-binding protein